MLWVDVAKHRKPLLEGTKVYSKVQFMQFVNILINMYKKGDISTSKKYHITTEFDYFGAALQELKRIII